MITMQTKISKKKLIEIIKTNRAKHEKDFNDASKIFKKDYEERVKSFLVDATKGIYHIGINLSQPIQYLRDYDQALRMLDLTTESIIELDSHLFSCLVDDNWEWKHSFLNNTGMYLNKQ